MLIFSDRIPKSEVVSKLKPLLTLSLTAEERTRTRHRFDLPEGQTLFFRLPRGIVIQNGDFLKAESG